MSKVIRRNTNPRQVVRQARKVRIKKKIARLQGTVNRLVIYRSNRFMYAQVIDDLKGQTLVQASTKEKDFSQSSSQKNLEAAKSLGKLVGQRAVEKDITKIVFDRNGYDYHGRIKAVADGAREAGLKF